MKDRITIEGRDGAFGGYISQPKTSPAPAIVVLQELFGVNTDIRKTCDELAEQGFLAVAPDLFWRQEPGVDLNVTSEADWQHGLRLYGAYDRDAGAEDVKDAVDAVRNLPECNGKIAVLGYCLGALMVFRLSEAYINRGKLERGIELARRALAIGEQTGEVIPGVNAHLQIAVAEYWQGRFASSHEHCEQAIMMHRPGLHHALTLGDDGGVNARAMAAWNLWQLGYPDRALVRCGEAVELARKAAHLFNVALALLFAMVLHWMRGDTSSQRLAAEALISLSETQGFPLLLGVGKAGRASALVVSGVAPTAVAEVASGLIEGRGTGNQAGIPAFMGMWAEAQALVGQPRDALSTLELALALSAHTGQVFWDAELHRMKGELVAAQAHGAVEAEAHFRRAVDIARVQEAKSFELRAATSLARVLRMQGKPAEAHGLLAPLYASFTEGFDTRDLIEAEALLEELG